MVSFAYHTYYSRKFHAFSLFIRLLIANNYAFTLFLGDDNIYRHYSNIINRKDYLGMKTDDIDVLSFARIISMLPPDPPISKAYDEKYGQKQGRWFLSQREHMVVWSLHYPTSGVHPFTHKPSQSTRQLLAFFGRPESLLWLAEALGEGQSVLTSLVEELENVKNPRRACSIIRKRIPWTRILELLRENSSLQTERTVQTQKIRP